jgi:hypothetical protein
LKHNRASGGVLLYSFEKAGGEKSLNTDPLNKIVKVLNKFVAIRRYTRTLGSLSMNKVCGENLKYGSSSGKNWTDILTF